MKINTITIQVSDRVEDLLDALVDSGLYGLTAAEAVERLLCQALDAKLDTRGTLRCPECHEHAKTELTRKQLGIKEAC